MSAAGAYTQFGQNANIGYQAGAAPQGYGGGVVPITQVPLHQYQRDALTQMGGIDHGGLLERARSMAEQQAANPQAAAAGYTAQGASAALDNMSRYASLGAGAFTGEDVGRYFNPYQSRLEESLKRETDKQRARLMAGTGRGGSRGAFGSTAFGTALGELETGANLNMGQLLYQGYADAQQHAGTEKQRQLQASQLFGNEAQTRQSIFDNATGLGQNAVSNMFGNATNYFNNRQAALGARLGAGGYIQGFNQNQANQLAGEIEARRNHIPNRIGFLGSALSGFPRTQGSAGFTDAGGTSASQFGGLATALGSTGIF